MTFWRICMIHQLRLLWWIVHCFMLCFYLLWFWFGRLIGGLIWFLFILDNLFHGLSLIVTDLNHIIWAILRFIGIFWQFIQTLGQIWGIDNVLTSKTLWKLDFSLWIEVLTACIVIDLTVKFNFSLCIERLLFLILVLFLPFFLRRLFFLFTFDRRWSLKILIKLFSTILILWWEILINIYIELLITRVGLHLLFDIEIIRVNQLIEWGRFILHACQALLLLFFVFSMVCSRAFTTTLATMMVMVTFAYRSRSYCWY